MQLKEVVLVTSQGISGKELFCVARNVKL